MQAPCPLRCPPRGPPQASLSASNNWGSLPSWSTFIFTEGLAVTSGVLLVHIGPWEGALLPGRAAWLQGRESGPSILQEAANQGPVVLEGHLST